MCLVHLSQHQAAVGAACKAMHLDAHMQGKERIEHTRSSGWRRSARLIVNEHSLIDKDRKKEEAASVSLS